jgi:hypothetical protein
MIFMSMTRCFLISCLALMTAACGSREQSAKLTATNDPNSELFTSIGRGAKLTLINDINISPNLHQVDIGPFEEFVLIDSYKHVYRKTWRYCGLMLKEASVDRRVIKSQSSIELSGEALTYPVNEGTMDKVEAVMVATPSAIDHVGCGKFQFTCEQNPFGGSMLCGNRRQSPFTMDDLQTVMKDVATIERAAPVVIPSR